MKRPLTREQLGIVLQGLLGLVVLLVLFQLLLLTATVNAYLGGDGSAVWPAALASLACCGVNAGCLRSLRTLERSQPAAE